MTAKTAPCQESNLIVKSNLQTRLTDFGSSSTEGEMHHFRIVIVDDNYAASFLLGKLLSRLGQNVLVAKDGPEALEFIRASNPHIVISDIAMPEMNGYELAGLIRKEFRQNSPYLVALTGFGATKDRQQSLDAGFQDHLVKPIGLPVLKTLLQNLSLILPAN